MALIILHVRSVKRNEKGCYFLRKSLIKEFIGEDKSLESESICNSFRKLIKNSINIKWNYLGADKILKKCKFDLLRDFKEENHYNIAFIIHQDFESIIRFNGSIKIKRNFLEEVKAWFLNRLITSDEIRTCENHYEDLHNR